MQAILHCERSKLDFVGDQITKTDGEVHCIRKTLYRKVLPFCSIYIKGTIGRYDRETTFTPAVRGGDIYISIDVTEHIDEVSKYTVDDFAKAFGLDNRTILYYSLSCLNNKYTIHFIVSKEKLERT
jgi:hypothetical protein